MQRCADVGARGVSPAPGRLAPACVDDVWTTRSSPCHMLGCIPQIYPTKGVLLVNRQPLLSRGIMRFPFMPAVLFVALAGLCGCDAPVPPELETSPRSVTVPAIPRQFTSAMKPALAVEVTPEKVYVSTHFLHQTWRERLREQFDAKRAENHWLAARREVNDIVERLDEEAPEWRAGRVEVATLHQGKFSDEVIKSESGLWVQPIFDTLFDSARTVGLTGSALGLADRWMHDFIEPCSDVPCKPYPNSLLLVIHPDVPSNTVEQVIHTASSARISEFQLLVNAGAGAPRMVPLRFAQELGPPSEESDAGSCAMPHVTSIDAQYLAFDRVQSFFDQSLQEPEEAGVVFAIPPRYPREYRGEWATRPTWDDAVVVESQADCHSGPLEGIAQTRQRLEGSLEAFDAAPVCNHAFFEFPRTDNAQSSDDVQPVYSQMVATIAGLAAAKPVKHVFVNTGSNPKIAVEAASDCSRVYEIGAD